jgi:SnoaL-like domain
MTNPPTHTNPAVDRSLATWHQMIAHHDLTELPTIVHPDAVFRSPMAITPYAPREALVLALTTVIDVFDDFTYHRQLATGDGLDVALEFSARVGDRTLKGVDLIRFDDDGLIREFEVMIRPLSGLQALGTAMGARLGTQLPAFKQPGSTVTGGSRPRSAADLLRTGRAPARPDEGEA